MSQQERTQISPVVEQVLPGLEPEPLAQVRELLLEYGQFVLAHSQSAHFCYGTLEKEAAELPDSYARQGGGCLCAWIESRPVAFVAWRAAPGNLAACAWEMKRLWVRPEARGTGLGRRLAQAVVERAREAGKQAVYLDTIPDAMPEAVKLYRAMGFAECEPYAGDAAKGVMYMIYRF